MSRKRILSGALAAMMLIGTQSGLTLAETETLEETKEQQIMMQIAEGSNALGSNLMAELTAGEENVFISPYSITMVLSMLSSCSESGEHVEKLREFLGYEGLSDEEIRDGHEWLLEDLKPYIVYDESLTEEEMDAEGIGRVEVANALYLSENLSLVPEFDELPDVLAKYQAEVNVKPLDTEETMKEMNDWVKENTHEMIESILDEPLSSDVLMMLMNTVYFKGFWANDFSEAMTDRQTFYGLNQENEVEMMHQTEYFDYAENDDYQVIYLPYCRGYEMHIYLPKDEAVYTDWADAGYLEQMKQSEYEIQNVRVKLSMPKFELEYAAEISEILCEMGLEDIFEEQVYDRISDDALATLSILHKTALKNDEYGTEAAAVTALLAGAGIRAETEPVEVVIDRPFYFTITDRSSGVNLFEGCIFDL